MPFTPFHLGPALSLGLPLRKYIHAPTFILANVAVDVEPFLVLFLRLNYPLHGYLHTFAFAFSLGLGLGLGMFFLERFLRPVYKVLLLEPNMTFGIRTFMVAGALGTMLHVLFDAPLYADIQPFYPMTTNPLYNSASSLEIYLASVWLGILGIVFYAGLLVFYAHNRFVKKSGKNKPSTMSN